MNLKFIKLELQWASHLPVSKLRLWLLDQIRFHGEPLRWAITSISDPYSPASHREITVEAFVIVHSL